MRRKIIVGNWKMNKTSTEAKKFVEEIKNRIHSDDIDVAISAPFTSLETLKSVLKDSKIKLAAQNMHYEDQGAYTGEISAQMLLDLAVSYVIIGHSERRTFNFESDEIVNKKTIKAFEYGLIPIVCCGETLEEREQGQTKEKIQKQVELAIVGIDKEKIEKMIIAYEPIWAIGTGKTASKEQANEVCGFIRDTVRNLHGDAADKLRIQYGGSVNSKNAKDLFEMSDIDGGLVGGASLSLEFVDLINNSN